jgi:hypothetical protein
VLVAGLEGEVTFDDDPGFVVGWRCSLGPLPESLSSRMSAILAPWSISSYGP